MAALKSIEPAIQPLARSNELAIRKAMTGNQTEAARLLGCVPSVVTDWKEDDMQRAAQMLAALSLRVCHKDDQRTPAAELAAYKLLARKAMDHEEPVTDFGGLE